jgi:hypothetical protein
MIEVWVRAVQEKMQSKRLEARQAALESPPVDAAMLAVGAEL